MTEGIRARLMLPGDEARDCLLVGLGIPSIHRSDGIPVYTVHTHPEGVPIMFKDKSFHPLVVYPSAWPSPGKRSAGAFVYVNHELMPFDAPLPLFDREDTPWAK